MTATSDQSETLQLSVMQAMHHRYEAAFDEYQAIEAAEAGCRDDGSAEVRKRELDSALHASCFETDALRVAILHQVPHDGTDAAILQYHALNSFDMLKNSGDVFRKEEMEALETAIRTLFDYTCRTIGGVLPPGAAFATSARQADRARRFRTGQVGGEQ